MNHPEHPQTNVSHMHNQAFQKLQCLKQGVGHKLGGGGWGSEFGREGRNYT